MERMNASEQRVVNRVKQLIQEDYDSNYWDDAYCTEIGGIIFWAGDYDEGFYPGVCVELVDVDELLGILGGDATEEEIVKFIRDCKEDAAIRFEEQRKEDLGQYEYDNWLAEKNYYPESPI